MGGVNAAIEVGKQQLVVQLGSQGEQFSEANEPRAIKRIAKRLFQAGCERVLIEGGSYQRVLIAGLRAAELPVVIVNPRRVRESARSIGQLAKTALPLLTPPPAQSPPSPRHGPRIGSSRGGSITESVYAAVPGR